MVMDKKMVTIGKQTVNNYIRRPYNRTLGERNQS